jgi:hypothetical protein
VIASMLERQPVREAAGLALFHVREVIHPPQGREIEKDWYYFEQLRDRGERRQVSHRFDSHGDAWLMIYRLKPFDSYWRLLKVECNGAPLAQVFSTYTASVYKPCQAANSLLTWDILFETDAPQWVDIHTF